MPTRSWLHDTWISLITLSDSVVSQGADDARRGLHNQNTEAFAHGGRNVQAERRPTPPEVEECQRRGKHAVR